MFWLIFIAMMVLLPIGAGVLVWRDLRRDGDNVQELIEHAG